MNSSTLYLIEQDATLKMMCSASETQMNMQEAFAIAAYKAEASMLGEHRLADLVLPDFLDTWYGEEGSWEALEKYIGEAERYSKQLEKAAYLRQSHYDRFVRQERLEDPGHQHWREGMNLVSEDALQKVKYWQQVSTAQFADFVKRSPQRLILLPMHEECECEEFQCDEQMQARKPALAKAEARRRKKHRRRVRIRKETAEAELEQKLLSVYPTPENVSVGVLDIINIENAIQLLRNDPDTLSKKKIINPLLILAPRIDITGDTQRLAAASRALFACSARNPSANLLAFILQKNAKFSAAFRVLSKKSTGHKGPILCSLPGAQKSSKNFAIACEQIATVLWAVLSYYTQYDPLTGWRSTIYLIQKLRVLQREQETYLLSQVSTQRTKIVQKALGIYKVIYKTILEPFKATNPTISFEVTSSAGKRTTIEYQLS